MTKFEKHVVQSLTHNATLFMKEAIRHILSQSGEWRQDLSTDDFILAVSNLQIAMEISLKAFLVRNHGIMSVVHPKNKRNSPSEADIQRLYYERKLNVQDFEALKNMLLNEGVSDLKKDDLAIISEFQTLRNKLLHMTCDVMEEDLKGAADRMLAYCIHIVMYLLYDKFQKQTPNEFFVENLGWDFYDKLQKCKQYPDLIEETCKLRGEIMWECPMCLKRTFSPDNRYCYCCNYELQDLHLTYCLNCGESRSVVYHHSPFVNQANTYSGLCLNCGAHPAVYECPDCHCCHEVYAADGKDYCSEGVCLRKSGIIDDDRYLHEKAEEVV